MVEHSGLKRQKAGASGRGTSFFISRDYFQVEGDPSIKDSSTLSVLLGTDLPH